MNDLKSQHAVESNGMRHIVGGQCDSADALDHRDTLHMIRSVRAHKVCHRLSRCFKYDFSEFFWWHSRPRAVKCAKSTAGHSRFVSDVEEGHACVRGPLCRLDHLCLRRLLRYSAFPFRPAVKTILPIGPGRRGRSLQRASGSRSRNGLCRRRGLPHDPLAAADGAIWYTGQMASTLGRLDPKTGAFKEYRTKTPDSGPHGLAANKDGNIWFTASFQGYIGKLDPKTGTIIEYHLPDPAARDPHTPVFDRTGVLWFTVQGANMVGRLVPQTGEVMLQPMPRPKHERKGGHGPRRPQGASRCGEPKPAPRSPNLLARSTACKAKSRRSSPRQANGSIARTTGARSRALPLRKPRAATPSMRPKSRRPGSASPAWKSRPGRKGPGADFLKRPSERA
jgi:hypothetical protein